MTSALVVRSAYAEKVICDPSADSENYYCRGWQDGVGPEGTRVRFIARMIGEDYEDDFAKFVTSLGDINSDGFSDFMVWVPGDCEWRIYLGDTLISKVPYLIWPTCSPGFPGNFALVPDISGDGEPDLFRFDRELLHRGELYFAGAAFDTICDLVFEEPEFELFGNAGHSVSGGYDINGDGDPDFVVGDPLFEDLENWRKGRAYVFWGGNALDSIPDLVFTDTFWTGQNQATLVGGELSVVPSINGDPYADLLIGRRSQNLVDKDPPGRVQIHLGGPAMDTIADYVIESPDTSWTPDYGYLQANKFGGTAVGIGDNNLDGYPDILISGSQIVPAYVYYGGPEFDEMVDLRLSQPWPTEQGESQMVVALGDVSGDGASDFCTVTRRQTVLDGYIRIHFARASTDGVLDWSIEGSDWLLASQEFGRQTQSLGDVDGDGVDDFAVGSHTSILDHENRGLLWIFAGIDLYPTSVFGDDDVDAGVVSVPRLIVSAFPNPFNQGTTVTLSGRFRQGRLIIYDILGRPVRRLLEGQTPETHIITWDGRDSQGSPLPSGLYFAHANDRVHSETIKLVLVR